MFAVIKTGGKQYRVVADDLLEVERLAGEPGEIIQFPHVLALGEGADVTIGAPFVDGASVAAEVVEQNRGPKVIAFKKRRRQNSRRKRGHRQLLTTVRISEILTGGAKPSKKAPKPAPKKAEAEAKPGKAEPAKAEAGEAAAAPLFTAPEGAGDDLTKIKGIGPVAARQLGEQGITTFAQIAGLSDADVARIDDAMPFSAEQIADWREQAKALAG
ncbi:50S ribosomal protein L21 [Aquibium sp. A9E412]|uniref:50S ribosomal protein L21 n=1 Tax=Aquibium sp. A9E412 TaxID=2976767 RepID=UPI0025B09449|nr:50S ribosomal protein L21 [Aquibium sp. A9E412]MDN2567730.1 50S ribosomal protein L21 [Aquibium sp. A9E412]